MQMLIYKNIDLNLAIEVDVSKKIIYAYDLDDGNLVRESRGILKSLASDVADELENKLEIRLSEFDVEIFQDIVTMQLDQYGEEHYD